jgi:hypothetical protein
MVFFKLFMVGDRFAIVGRVVADNRVYFNSNWCSIVLFGVPTES